MNGVSFFTSWLSTWGVIKAAGLTSYLLMLLSIVLGAFSYGTTVPAKIRGMLLPAHQFAGWLGFLFGLLHGIVLTIDKYQPFALSEVLVPFTAGFHPLTLGLGTIALYVFAAILISSDVMKRLGKRMWRYVHLLSYPAFIFSLTHALADGSDIDQPWALQFYTWSALLFVAVLLFRGFIQWKSGRKSLAVK